MLTFNLANPSHLAAALLPDLILMGGAMLLLLFAVWRRESAEHQRQASPRRVRSPSTTSAG